MRRNKNSLKLLFIFTLLVIAGGFLFYSTRTEAQQPKTQLAEYKKGEVIVKLKSPGSEASALSAGKTNHTELGKIARKLGVTDAKKLFPKAKAEEANQVFRISLPEDKDVVQAVAEYQKSGLVEYAEPNYVARMNVTTPDDSLYSTNQWYLNNTTQTGGTADADIDAAEAWDIERGETSVVVAVIDSGVDLDHPDLNANIWTNSGETANNSIDDDSNGYVDDTQGWDYYSSYNVDNVPANFEGDNDPNPNPDGLDNDWDFEVDGGVNHGTHVAGTIAAETNNAAGVAGVAWNVKLMALRALDDEGSGYYSEMASALYYAADNGADVINMSLGGSSDSTTLEAAVDYAYNAGAAVIVAAGNSAADLAVSPHYPACFTNAFTVAATDHDDIASYFTNYGDCAAGGEVDISGPGSSIHSTYYYDPTWSFNNYYGSMSGTSMATPVVAGVAALLESHNMTLTPAQIYSNLETYADDVVTPYHLGTVAADYGAGRVNANASLGGTSENVDTTPPTNPTIKAYTGSGKAHEIEFATRTTDTAPYFEWTGASDTSGIAGYYLYFGTESTANPVVDGTFVTKTQHKPTGLSGDEQYYYLMVRAKDSAGNLASAKTYFSYLMDIEAAAPTGLTAEMQSGGIMLDWTAGDTNAASYNIYRAETSGGSYTHINSGVAVTDTELLDDTIDTSSASGTTYYYVITTVDDLGNESDYSDEASSTYYAAADLVVGTEDGGAPQVLVYDYEGNLKSQFFAYSSSLRTGVSVATGDLDGDGTNEIITGPGAGGGPQVRVFDMEGNPKITAGFFAYATTVRNGVMVGAGDLDGDGDDEIITGTRAGSGPHVRTFDSEGNAVFSPGFFAYGTNVRNGVFVAACDLNGNGKKEIVTGTDTGSGPHVRTFDRFGTAVFTPGFFAYEETFRGGTRMACGDLTGNGRDEILTIPGEGGGAQVKVFNLWGEPTVTAGFFAFATSWRGGSFISAGDVDQDGLGDIIVSADGGGTPLVVVYDQDGTTLLSSFYGLPSTYTAGINVAAGAFPE